MKLGPRGERIAARTLKRAGYRIIERNYRSKPGEIDLIALDGDTLVFVEVKTRTSADAADPQDAVNRAKQRQLGRVARYYVQAKSAHHRPCRFDVVTVVLSEEGKPTVEHFINAFELDSSGRRIR